MARLLFLIALGCVVTDALAEIRVTDYAGRQVVLERGTERIIGLSPHIIENLYAAGLGERVVGAVAHADFPPIARALPRVGRFDTYDLEAILALKPDLVIAWGSGNGPRVVRQLQRLGIPVYVDEPKTLEDIVRSLHDFAMLAGQPALEAEAIEAIKDYRATLARLREHYAGQKLVSVLYQVWHKPLQTLNGDHIVNDVIALCGGSNVFADSAAQAPKINMEAVTARDPQVIIVSGVDTVKPAWFDQWQAWPNLTAVRSGTIYHLPPDLIQRHTPRILQGAELMCRYLEQARRRLTF